MSDGFDKEAEREKLRQRFEQEKEDRESTQVMSDLLLKGATMTNKHCNECGDPVFRQSGQEFCPSCHGNDGQEAAGANTPAEQQSTATEEADQQPGSGEGQVQSPAGQLQAATSGQQTAENQQQTAGSQQQTAGSQQQTAGSRQHGSTTSAERQSPAKVPTTAPDTTATTASSDTAEHTTPLDSAKASLAAAIETHAGRAAEADDPRDAREHLEAAHEAAAAIAALRQSD